MSLAEFQGIFWWEWTHRLIAQLIGVAFAVPFAWFLIRRQLPRRLIPYLVGLFVLGGLQGLLGWAMVASGLVDRPSVSHYRLAAHLSMDLTIYSLTLWTAFFVSRPRATLLTPVGDYAGRCSSTPSSGSAALAITIVWGAFTAGLRAGLVYNTFPLMGGGIAPPDLFGMHPWWSNFVENPGSVQFVHRMLAMTTGLIILALALRLRGKGIAPELGKLATALFVIVAFQITLGIETVLHQVPVWLGALHQANAILLLGIVVRTLFLLRLPYTRRNSSRGSSLTRGGVRLVRQGASIDQQGRAGHQHRKVAGAEQGDPRDVVGHTQPPERQGGANLLFQRLDSRQLVAFGLGLAFLNAGRADASRRQAQHAYLVRAPLHAEALGQADDAML